MSQNIVIILVLVAALVAVLVLLLMSMRSREKLLKAMSEQKRQQPQAAPATPSPELSNNVPSASPEEPAPARMQSEAAAPAPSVSVISSVKQDDDAVSEPLPVSDIKDATLLIVEDDNDLREFVAEELATYVSNVLQARDGLEAQSILNSQDVSIVVSDVMMPRMDGFALCHYIKTTIDISHIPVILLTARSDSESRVYGYKNGADEYITKPFDFNVLVETIKKLFYGRELARQRVSSRDSVNVAEVTFSSADEKFMKKFDEFIHENISSPELDTKMLVEHMGMSRTVLFNKVKQLTGLNLQGYTNKVRIEHVKKLLSTTDLPIGEVARLSGFSSSRYLSTSFKNYTGVTPSEYKRDHQE